MKSLCVFLLLCLMVVQVFGSEGPQQPELPRGVNNFRRLIGNNDEASIASQLLPFVSNVFGSNMVLQRSPHVASIWGWTNSPESTVTVVMDGMTVASVISDSTGFWATTLPATEASFTPHELSLSSDSGDVATLTNVLFGDVYLCGGQSNMQFTVSEGFNASEEIAAADNYPNIRLFTVGQGNISYTPSPVLISFEQGWSVASSSSVGGSDWTYFSAVCWFFVRDLFNSQNIPIGAISSNWGGTFVQAWSSSFALEACPSTLPLPKQEQMKKGMEETEEMEMEMKKQMEMEMEMGMEMGMMSSPPNPNQNSVLFNAMIVPFIGMSMRGAIWYQGEANIYQPAYYACAFPAMISDWRFWFGLSPSEFGFFFVQLAPYTEGSYLDGLALTRLAQTAALSLPVVGMATTIDLGDLGSTQGNIHPMNKQTVGARLALNALYFIYNETQTLFSGPFPVNTHLGPSGIAVQTIVSTFTDTAEIILSIPFSEPLILVPNVTCPPSIWSTNCSGFEIQTSDGVWHPATNSTIQQGNDGSNLMVSLWPIQRTLVPWGVRYAFSNWPLASLYGEASGLPAPPFTIQFQLELGPS